MVHDSNRWKNGQRRNIPPADGSDDTTAWSTPSWRSEYDTCSAPGPLPTTTTGYSPGGNGRQAACLDLQHPVHHAGMVDQELLDAGPGQDEAAQRTGGDDIRDRGFAEDDRHLPEEVAPGQARPFVAVDQDRGLAVENDVESGPGQALAQDAFAVGIERLLEDVNDRGELRIGQVGEQREARNGIHQLLARDHAGMVPHPGRRCDPNVLTGRGRAAQHGPENPTEDA